MLATGRPYARTAPPGVVDCQLWQARKNLRRKELPASCPLYFSSALRCGPSFYPYSIGNPSQPRAFMSLSACTPSPQWHHVSSFCSQISTHTSPPQRSFLCPVLFFLKHLKVILKLSALPTPPHPHSNIRAWLWSVLLPPVSSTPRKGPGFH